MRTAVVSGSFDPVTSGHLDIIKRAARVFDRVYAVCFINEEKSYMFSLEQRRELLKKAVEGLDNVAVDSFGGWLYEYVKSVDACAIIRGIRDEKDIGYEREMAQFNKEKSGADTMFFLADERFCKISSTKIRAIIENQGEIAEYVPESIIKMMKGYLNG